MILQQAWGGMDRSFEWVHKTHCDELQDDKMGMTRIRTKSGMEGRGESRGGVDTPHHE
jgi:hypothetical protein